MRFCMFFFFFIKLNYKAVSLDPECLAQTLIQLETFSFTPNGVLVWCTLETLECMHNYSRLSHFLNMLNTDDKTAREYASACLFFGYVSRGSCTTARFPEAPEKNPSRCEVEPV